MIFIFTKVLKQTSFSFIIDAHLVELELWRALWFLKRTGPAYKGIDLLNHTGKPTGFSTELKYLEKDLLKASWADLNILPMLHLQSLKTTFSSETVRRNHHLSPFWMFFPKHRGLLNKSIPFAYFSDPCMGKKWFKCFLSASPMSSLFTWLE